MLDILKIMLQGLGLTFLGMLLFYALIKALARLFPEN